jgi:hypothetical protein
MIYSRWGNGSVWYCFWNKYKAEMKFKLPTNRLKNKQTFQIYDVPSYYVTYGYIKENGIGKVLDDINGFYRSTNRRVKEKEMMNLMLYINKFIDSVDQNFKPKAFFYNNWILPIKQSKYGRILKTIL